MPETGTPASFDAIRGLIARELHEYGMKSTDAAKIVAAVSDADIGRAVQGVLVEEKWAFAMDTFRSVETGKARAHAFVTDYSKHAAPPEGHYGVSCMSIALNPIVTIALNWRGGPHAGILN